MKRMKQKYGKYREIDDYTLLYSLSGCIKFLCLHNESNLKKREKIRSEYFFIF